MMRTLNNNMKMKKLVSTLLLVFTVAIIGVKAQTIVSPTDVQLVIEPQVDITLSESEADTLVDPFDAIDDNLVMDVSVVMTLSDTATVSLIHVKVGRTTGANDIIEHTFTFDNFSPGSGLIYEREENSIRLGVGGHSNAEILYAEVYLEDSSGHTSEIILTNTED